MNQSFFLSTLEVHKLKYGKYVPTQIIYHDTDHYDLLKYLVKNVSMQDTQLYYILNDHTEVASYPALKWAHYNTRNIKIVPRKLQNMQQLYVDYFYGARPYALCIANTHILSLNAVGALNVTLNPTDMHMAMIGNAIDFPIPKVIGVHIKHRSHHLCNIHDLYVELFLLLQEHNDTYTCFEFFGDGLLSLSIYDRISIATLQLGYNSFCFFPIDSVTLSYLSSKQNINYQEYLSHAEKHSLISKYHDHAVDRYESVIEINLEQLNQVAILSDPTHNRCVTAWYSKLPMKIDSIPTEEDIIFIIDLSIPNSQLVHFLQIVKIISEQKIQTKPGVILYLNSDNKNLISYLKETQLEAVVIELGGQFQGLREIEKKFTERTTVMTTSIDIFLQLETKVNKVYLSSSIHIMFSYLMDSVLISELNDSAQFASLLLEYQNIPIIWEQMMTDLVRCTLKLSRYIFIGRKIWHAMPIVYLKDNHPDLKDVVLHKDKIYQDLVPRYASESQMINGQNIDRDPTIIIGQNLRVSSSKNLTKIMVILSDRFDEHIYATSIMNGILPIKYNIKRLKLYQDCIVKVQVMIKSLEPQKRVKISLLLKNKVTKNIVAICAIKNIRDYEIYLNSNTI